ncbi:MAG TPA: hypothetical protein VMT56_00610 [Candidatus Bathyarchaeia archaeon]|nr:hypothetical protein [Candidatus Bathyarchaeia archaeon]
MRTTKIAGFRDGRDCETAVCGRARKCGRELWRLAIVAALAVAGWLSPGASAQSTTTTAKDEIFGGYAWLAPNGWGELFYKIDNMPKGFDASNTYYLPKIHNLGVLLDGSGHFKGGTTPPNLENGSDDSTGVGYALAGLQYKFHRARISPFFRVMLGGANLSPDCCHGMEWSFAAGGGGGLDLKLKGRFSLRLIQADYIHSNYSHLVSTVGYAHARDSQATGSYTLSVDHPTGWNSVRLAAGLVISLGNYKEPTRPQPTSPAKPAGKHQARQTVDAMRVPLDMAVSAVISSGQLRNLPLYNRNFLALGLLAPSTHDVPAWSELKDTTFSISGQRPTSNEFLLDGMDNVATGNNQAIPFQVNDAIQEFRVTTATSDAQYGRNIGGVVNVITQRGTARFHGSVFGFFASDTIDASSPLSVYGGSGFDQAAAFAGPVNAAPAPNRNGPRLAPIYQPTSYNQYVSTIGYINSTYGKNFCAAPNATPSTCLQYFDPAAILAQNDSHTQPFSSQQFGGQAGGWLLKRWYWFGDYEGTRIDNPNPVFERVPSSYDRSHLDEFDPETSGYQDAQIAAAVLALYPQANVKAIPDVLEFYRGQAPNYTNVDNYLGRLDFTQSGRTNWTFRYNAQNLSQLHDDTLPSSSL